MLETIGSESNPIFPTYIETKFGAAVEGFVEAANYYYEYGNWQ